MRNICLSLSLYCASVAYAQQPQPAVTVPKLVRFSGSFRPANGPPAQTMESVTLSVYRDQTGGDALWHEIQNVVVGADGRYSVLMGATQNEGVPLDLFASGEPRWLGVQFNRPGEAEQARTLLVSVPYALKSVDADTLGGKPASAYLLAAPEASTPAAGLDAASVAGVPAGTTTARASVKPKAIPANNGLPNYIGKFTNTTDLIDSAMYEVNGNVGIFTTTPTISLDVRTGSLPQMGIAGKTDYLTFFASDQYGPAIYWDPAKDMRFGKGGSGLYNPYGFVEQMRIQSSTGNVGIGTQTPLAKLDVAGSINFTQAILFNDLTFLQMPGGVQLGNTGLGVGALQSVKSGNLNTATGNDALQNNTTGGSNTASGYGALGENITGSFNTASGVAALGSNTGGSNNTACGSFALRNNTTGGNNTAIGSGALQDNTMGEGNTAIGSNVMTSNTSGGANIAVGPGAMQANTTGNNNTAIGISALAADTTGSQNTAIGWVAMLGVSTGSNNTALGALAGSGGSNNIDIGYSAGSAGGDSNNIHIGNPGSAGESGAIRIGTSGVGGQISFFAAGIRGATTGNDDAIPVLIDSNGQLGTVSSSRRFKEDIQDMGAASNDLLRLRPVTFRYKNPFADGSKPIQYGLIAEEVAEVYPDLVAQSADGQIETVKYQVLDSMLLNEAQRQQVEIRRLQQQINQQHQEITEQRRQNQSLQERLARLESALASMSGVSTVPSIR